MDEKGFQMDGGCKNNGRKFYHPCDMKKKHIHCIRSDNLELVMIVECILAAGVAMPPAFILSDGPMPDCMDVKNLGR
jgi:hypothetical protein